MMKLGIHVAVALALITSWATPGRGGGVDVYSGRLTEVVSGSHSITVEEITTWTGPLTEAVRHTVVLTPDTRVSLVRRDDDVEPTQWPGQFATEGLARSELRSGDWVNVAAKRQGDHLVAVSIEVVRP